MEQLTPTSAQRYYAAIFLRHFTSQRWESLDCDNASDFELARFACLFCVKEFPDKVHVSGDYRTLALSDANLIIGAYTSRSLNPKDGVLHDDGNGHVWKYENGTLYFPKKEGVRYNLFPFVREIWRMSDGTLKLVFDVYELNAEEYDKNGLSESLFWLDRYSAQELVDKGSIRKVGSGTAITWPNLSASYDFYRMVRYDVMFD